MSALSNTMENSLLLLLFNNTNISNVGDATGLRGSSSAGSFYMALHTSDPGETGNQSTNECAYTSYARVAVARTSGGFTVSGDTVTNTAAVTFPEATGGSETATHISVGVASGGSTVMLMRAALSTSIPISSTVEPTFDAGQISFTAA